MSQIPRSVVIAGIILLAFLAYFGIRTGLRAATASGSPEIVEVETEDELPTVTVRSVLSEQHAIFETFKGRTEANRSVTVRSETSGTVITAGSTEGTIVSTGQTLCRLDVESRAARVAEAEANLTARKLEYDSAATLQEKGWTTSNRAAALKAASDQAEAGLAAAKIELAKTRVKAPFQGVFERRHAEVGDFLSPGAPCGDVVDLDPLLISFEATESSVLRLQNGQMAEIELTSGATLPGEIRFVARSADAATRTFRVEVEIDNPDFAIPAGLTAAIKIPFGEAEAAQISPASLVLHDDGRVGVRYVDADDIVQFAEVMVIDDVSNGIWVTGLPEDGRLLVQGQDFVKEGTHVQTIALEGT